MWENSWLKIKRPDTFAKRLAYHKFGGLEHLSEENVFNKELHGYKKKGEIWKDLKEEVSGLYNHEHSILESIYKWWENVHLVEPRDIEIFMPLRDKSRDYNSSDFEDAAMDLPVDPLSPIRSNPKKLIETLEDIEVERDGILDKTHINFLDPLFLPFPINADEFPEYSGDGERPVPENLEKYYRRHSVSKDVFDSKNSVEQRVSLVKNKLEEGMSLEGRERDMYDSEDERFDDDSIDEYRKYMNHCKGIIQRMCKLQMEKFIESQDNGDNYLYLFGFKGDLGNVLPDNVLENDRYEKVIPTENRSGKTRDNVIRGGLQDDISLKSLKNRIERTYCEDLR